MFILTPPLKREREMFKHQQYNYMQPPALYHQSNNDNQVKCANHKVIDCYRKQETEPTE